MGGAALVIEQTEYDLLRRSSSALGQVLPKLAVCARMTPAGKVSVVQDTQAAGHYVGKEDFEISRSGVTLRVRGRTAEGQGLESLVAGLDESVQLPLDADWEGIAAEFVHPTLRVTVPRLPPEQVPARVLPPELMRRLEGLSIEQAQALLPVTKGRPFHRVLWRAALHAPVASGARPDPPGEVPKTGIQVSQAGY